MTALLCLLFLLPVQDEPLVVTAVPLQRKTLTRRIEQTGDIQADRQTPLLARSTGFVKKVHKDIGDPVKEGELLAEVAVPELQEELEQKLALVVQAKAELTLAKKLHLAAVAESRSFRAKVKEAESSGDRATAELRRAESQLTRLTKSSGVVAQEIVDEARLVQESARAAIAEVSARIKSAEAAATSAEAREGKAEADIEVAEAKVKVAEAESRRVRELVGYARLTAPFAGIVTQRHVDPGHFLQPSQGGKSEPAFVVASIDPVRVRLEIPENDAVFVMTGKNATRATVSVAALNREEFRGEVTRTSWALDPKIRTLRVEIELKNPKQRLRPGMYVTATLHGKHPDALLIPFAAVQTQGDTAHCFLLDNGKAIRTAIKTGLRDGDLVEVTQRRAADQDDADWLAFTGKEKVITSPLGKLTNGQAVKEAD